MKYQFSKTIEGFLVVAGLVIISGTTGFGINFGVAPAVSTSYNFNYFVIETK